MHMVKLVSRSLRFLGLFVVLKKAKYSKVLIDSLSDDCIVNIAGQTYRINGFKDQPSRRLFLGLKSEGTLVVVKPDAYSHMGSILSRLQMEGLVLVGARLALLGSEEVESLNQDSTRSFSSADICEYMTSDAVLAFVLSGEDAVSRCQTVVGPEDSLVARETHPSSLRALFGRDSFYNAIHASESRNQADREVKLVLGKGRPTAVLSFCSLCIIKPHCVNPHSGNVLDLILKNGFEISAVKMFTLTMDQIRQIMEVYRGIIPEYGPVCEHLASGPIVAIEVRGEDVVTRLRTLVGPFDPTVARRIAPSSIRAVYGESAPLNAVHCTDLEQDGMRECRIVFGN